MEDNLRNKTHFASHIIIVVIFCWGNVLQAQNLVPNPSFESYSDCPTTINLTFPLLNDWYVIRNTPDYYNCSFQGPFNGVANQTAHSGTGFVRFFNSEPFGIRLSEPLEANKTYGIRFFACLSRNSLPVDGLKMVFSEDSICEFVTLDSLSQVPITETIDDTLNWTEITASYVAQGCEQFIGFDIEAFGSATLFIDDVEVYCDDPNGCIPPNCNGYDFDVPNVFTPNGDGVNDIFEVAINTNLNLQIQENDPVHSVIVNRWGQVMAKSSLPNLTWDGTYNGRPAAEGVYFYQITYQTEVCGNSFVKEGVIHLFR